VKQDRFDGVDDRKRSYRELCAQEPTIPLFARDWWLDAAAGEANWDVAVVQGGSEIVAAMPYMLKKRFGFTVVGQPTLTPSLGPWMRSHTGKDVIGQQKKLQEELLNQLPRFDYFLQSWHRNQTNWAPFYWGGFTQTTRYTYVLHDLSDEKKLWDGLHGNIRREIKKASERFALRVRDIDNIDTFLSLNRKVYERQGVSRNFSDALVKRIDRACAARNCRKILVAEDEAGLAHSGVYLVWDEHSAYYLMGGSDPKLRTSGAASLCMWEAVRHAASVTRQFDFEGSMIEPIERFFREFGAAQVPFFHLTKTPSRLLRTWQFLADLKKV
jgi:hypothetical protein